MSLHVFVRFEPAPGKAPQLHDELLALMAPTRSEPGCLHINLYEATRDPLLYCIHSEWTDEAAFDRHRHFPHMTRFLALVPDLITHPIRAVRTRQLD